MKNEKYFHKIGWVMFIICSLFYIASAVRSKDMLSVIGGVFFLVACLVFMVPLLRSNSDQNSSEQDEESSKAV